MKRSPTFWLKISAADNGYVLEYDNELNDDGVRRQFIAVEENSMGDDAECAQRLLYEVLEHFGVHKRITISISEDEE